MKLLARFFFLIFSVGMTASCAPITVQYYSVEYIYENRRVDSTGDPTWIEKIVYTFDYEKEGRVTSAFVYENGNETKPIAYLLYTYWDLNELSHQAIDNRLRTVERYSDDDIFKTENGAKVKDPVKSVSKLIRYDVYETDAKDGKCLSVKTYRYNSHDPVIENRNIPMSAKQFKYFSDLSSRFLPEEETVSLFLAGRWVYQSSARIRYEKISGKKAVVEKRFFVNPVSEEDWYCIETFTYDDKGYPVRVERYTAEEYRKDVSVRIPEKTVLYVTEEKR